MNDLQRRIDPSESRLDRAIDRAVRTMMHVDPRPGLRGRVLARLESEPARSPLFPGFALFAGALALVILAVFVTVRSHRSTPAPPAAVHRGLPEVQLPPSPAVEKPPVAATAQPSGLRIPARTPHARRLTSEPIPMPPVANVFGKRGEGVAAAASVDDALWSAPAGEAYDDRPGGLPPLVIPAVDAPAPIVVAPLNPRGPGQR